jgi:hypothetical protein
VCLILSATATITRPLLHAQNDETNDSIKFLLPHPIVAADALLAIGTAVISAVLSLDEHLSQTDTSCVDKFCYQSCIVVLFGASLSGYELLSSPRTAANDFDAK